MASAAGGAQEDAASNDASLAAHEELLSRYAPLRWWLQGTSSVIMYWDPKEEELQWWNPESQAWDDGGDEDTKEWFDALPLATLDRVESSTGSPGMLATLRKSFDRSKASASSSSRRNARAANHESLLLHQAILGRYAPLRWLDEDGQGAVLCWDSAGGGTMQWWDQELQAWDDADEGDAAKVRFDALPLATSEQIETATGSPGMLASLGREARTTAGQMIWASSNPASRSGKGDANPAGGSAPQAAQSLLSAYPALGRYAPLRWQGQDDGGAVLSWDLSVNELMWWDAAAQGWDDADADETKAWFDQLPLATLEQLRDQTGTPGMLKSLS